MFGRLKLLFLRLVSDSVLDIRWHICDLLGSNSVTGLPIVIVAQNYYLKTTLSVSSQLVVYHVLGKMGENSGKICPTFT